MQHRLTDKDTAARKAVCSVCGPVTIYKAGPKYICSIVQKERMAKWKRENPAAAAANRAKESIHKLTKSGCAICGEVMPVPYGRGYACPNTPAVLRRGIQQDAPAQRCKICNEWERADRPFNDKRECGECELDRLTQESHVAPLWHENSSPDLPPEYHGYHVVDPETDNPYWDEPENVVHGWRVIGDPELIVHE